MRRSIRYPLAVLATLALATPLWGFGGPWSEVGVKGLLLRHGVRSLAELERRAEGDPALKAEIAALERAGQWRAGGPPRGGPEVVPGLPLGPDGYGYYVDNIPSGFVDISGTGTDIGISGDDVGAVIPIGFTFEFYGHPYTTLGVSSNGYLSFGGDRTDYTNDPIPSSSAPDSLIAALWDDLLGGGTPSGRAYYQVLGSAPSRRLVVQWDRFHFFGDASATLTFEVTLEEGTNAIEVHYATLTASDPNKASGGSATVGVEDVGEDQTRGLEVVFDAAGSLHPGDAIRYIITNPPPAPVTGLRVDERGDTATASWTNAGAYDSLVVVVSSGGAPVARQVLPGSATDATVPGLAPARYVLAVRAYAGQAPGAQRSLPFFIGPLGPDAFGYVADNIPAGFIDISGTGQPLALAVDDGGVRIPVGFPFRFYGHLWDSVGVSSNGYLTFGTDLADYSNDTIPVPLLQPQAFLAPLWDDFNPLHSDSSAGAPAVYREVRGAAPTRALIVQWTNWPFYGEPRSACTFEAILREGRGDVEYQYSTLLAEPRDPDRPSGSSATTGIEAPSGAVGIAVTFEEAGFLNPGDAFLLRAPEPPELHLALVPDSLAGSPGETVTVTLVAWSTLSRTSRPLQWSLRGRSASGQSRQILPPSPPGGFTLAPGETLRLDVDLFLSPRLPVGLTGMLEGTLWDQPTGRAVEGDTIPIAIVAPALALTRGAEGGGPRPGGEIPWGLVTTSLRGRAGAGSGAGAGERMPHGTALVLQGSGGRPGARGEAPVALWVAGGAPGEPAALDIYSIRGQRLRGLWRGAMAPGGQKVLWDGRDERGARLPAGLYWARLTQGGATIVRKVALGPRGGGGPGR